MTDEDLIAVINLRSDTRNTHRAGAASLPSGTETAEVSRTRDSSADVSREGDGSNQQ